MDETPSLHKCVNDCSGTGACVHNVCKCHSGTWGIDCSLPSAASRPCTRRPCVYVYEMPPRFTAWLAAFRKGNWMKDHWYGVDVILHAQLLRSAHRTTDADAADYFFVPLYLSLGFYSHRYYFKHLTQPAEKVVRAALRYVGETWPCLDTSWTLPGHFLDTS